MRGWFGLCSLEKQGENIGGTAEVSPKPLHKRGQQYDVFMDDQTPLLKKDLR